jgi:23S rRNA pseudouridine2605 synthase
MNRPGAGKDEPRKRVMPSNPRGERLRLNRYLALCGVCSRRQAMILVQEGRISINGELITEPGYEVLTGSDVVRFDGERVKSPRKWVYYAFNKPKGVLVTAQDELGREGIEPYLKRVKEHVNPVGRLDRASEGLLLLTNHGELANRLLHPRYKIEKTYHVTVNPTPRSWQLAKMAGGLQIGYGEVSGPAEVHVKRGGRRAKAVVLRMTLWEGKKREIRRICRAVNLRVLRLRRMKFAGIRLTGLPVGQIRPLSDEEVASLAELTGLNL